MTIQSVPIDFVTKVTPAVVSAGGDGVDVVGVLLTPNVTVPIGEAMTFGTPAEVLSHFGPGSAEAAFAATYFLGYDGSPQKPAELLVAQYPLAGVPAYLQGGTLATPLATLPGLASGTPVPPSR